MVESRPSSLQNGAGSPVFLLPHELLRVTYWKRFQCIAPRGAFAGAEGSSDIECVSGLTNQSSSAV